LNYELLQKAAAKIATEWPNANPNTSLICGSGWSAVIDSFDVHDVLPFEEIPGMGKVGVVGHAGKLSWGSLHGVETFIFQGRRHYYEGEGWTPIALPIYVSKQLGVQNMILTNSAGCMNKDFAPGDLMIITDHINMTATNPLIGPHHEVWGPRFPDQSYVYNLGLRKKIKAAADKIDLAIKEGIYLVSTGPVYESPAEIRMFRQLGADAVGMSTVPEAILANAAGLTVAGLSCMTNFAAGILDQPLTHAEVTDTTRQTMPKMKALLEAFWAELG
jgi:purine-nucleoside phosphorylase